ncbi:hypothetical protein CPB84DRAFT_1791546 [Gymnopilus junonius]|uniref:F-box domain-containing protein n=1 Tax=Gymnopilus junonius TaxID=109634 RepID=A0A9P5NG81_GYMJU|nr:hypothetical protein CPB84DRAFT_1791546 [Gymnopilus junonius]
MTDINDIPPEILASVFELTIYTSSISSLRPLSIVCRHWHDVVEQTPRLWGIVLLRKQSSPAALEKQITKAKAAPLSITLFPGTRSAKHTKKVYQKLTDLSINWVMANVGTEFISACRWVALYRSLEELTLCRGGPRYDEPGPFFNDVNAFTQREAKLRSFTATNLQKAWVIGFLGPSIRQFCLVRGYPDLSEQVNYYTYRLYTRIADTWDYLSRLPEVIKVHLKHLKHNDPKGFAPSVIRLSKLLTLHVEDVLQMPILLSYIAAPHLQTLCIDQRQIEPLSFSFRNPSPVAPLFACWSDPSFLPANLHTLELRDCLEITDVPYLIRWLERLPNLIRLFIGDGSNVLGKAPSRLSPDDGESNLYRALAHPMTRQDGESFWLCPSLMILHLDADQDIGELLSIARTRGGIASAMHDIPPPNRLRRVEALLCNTGREEEIELLGSLVDQAYCLCTSCGLRVLSKATNRLVSKN